jgi:hypothetical protein
MDPYLEMPHYWESFHSRLIFHMGSVLQEVLPPDYTADFAQRVELVLEARHSVPDVAVTRPPETTGAIAVQAAPADPATLARVRPQEVVVRSIQVLRIPDRVLVGVIELSSPTNKTDPRGREAYRPKQQSVLCGDTHLIEIDLLRAGAHWAAVPEVAAQAHPPDDYLGCVSRAGRRDLFECYFRTVREPLPRIGVPLLAHEPDASLDLQAAFDRAYDQGRYAGRVRYERPLSPPLRRDDEEWARSLLRERGLCP